MAQPIVFVTPRYGLDVVGGAEMLARMLAEALHRTGTPVEVLTTCTRELGRWNDDYEPGATTINGVLVRRFRVDSTDVEPYHALVARIARMSGRLSYPDQQQTIALSLNSQALYTYLKQHADRYRCCIVMPYLFGTTYHAAQIMREKTIHIPCLHDEPMARLAIFHDMLNSASGILFNTVEEQQLARRLGVTNPAAAVVGCGFDPPPDADPAAFRARHGLGDAPFLFYLGRFEPVKNVPLLLHFFQRYKRERMSPLKLALAGRGPVDIPEHPDIVDLGFVPQEEIADALAAATAVVQLSLNESFSLVLMESWLHGRPVIVHRDCDVTRGHVERSGGGWPVGDYKEFAAALDALAAGDEADRRGADGRAYVLREYSWDAALGRFNHALDQFLMPRTLYQNLAHRGRQRAREFTAERYDERLRAVIDRAQPTQPLIMRQSAKLANLRDLARVARPGYRVESGLPVVGPLVAWLRTQLTSHLREPYIDQIVQQQERFNLAVQEQIAEISQRAWQAGQRADVRTLREQGARIAALEAQVAALETQLRQLAAERAEAAAAEPVPVAE